MIYRTTGALGLALILSAGVATADSAAVETFDPAYFAAYHPSTALDMVRQVPGFSISEGDAVRGFGGAAGNVLLNGERPSSKTGLNDALKRVPADSVARIELVTGASASFDMRGQSKIVNIVMRDQGPGRSPVAAEVLFILAGDGQITGRVDATTQLAVAGGTLTVAGEYGSRALDSRERLTRDVLDANGVLTVRGAGWKDQRPLMQDLSLDFERPASWGALRLNASLSPQDRQSHRYFELRDARNGSLTGIEASDGLNNEMAYTFGGDIQRDFTNGSAKLITYHARKEGEYASALTLFDAAGGFVSTTTTRPERSSGESILRGQVDWSPAPSHSVQVALEAAYNFLDSLTGFERETPAGSTRFFVDGSDTTVEEYRSELQVSDVWKVSPALTLEPGMKFEVSRIEQVVRFDSWPALEAQRAFSYPKPFVSANWRLAADRRLNLSLERKVAQLSFNDFVSSVELINDQTTSGNPDLEPEQTWAVGASLEQTFWRSGVLTLEGSYDDVESVQDYLPIQTAAGFSDAPGNIGEGQRWSLGMKFSAPLDPVGIANARLDVSVSTGASEVIDPTTLTPRAFSGEESRSFDVSYRQDFPAQKFSYGLSLNDGGPAWTYRLGETNRIERDAPEIGAWVETTAAAGLRTRLGVNNANDTGRQIVRSIYSGRRDTSGIASIWDSNVSNGVRCYLSISGSF